MPASFPRPLFIASLILLFLFPGFAPCNGQTTEPYWASEFKGPRADNRFPQSSFDVTVGVQGLTTISPSSDSLGFFTFGVGYHVVKDLSVNAEFGVAPGNLESDRNAVRAFDGLFFARWHFLQSGRLSLYADGGIGALHAVGHFPITGRADNLLLGAGIGVAWRVGDNIHFTAGARYVHITAGDVLSNQSTHPAESLQYTLGLMILR